MILSNLDRLEALKATGLFGSKPEAAFIRLNHLATKLLKAPISIFSLIGEKSQFFKSAVGFEITDENNEVPIDVSVCQYSLQGKPFSIEDTLSHPYFKDNPAVKGLNIAGYLGIPVITKSGQPIGAVCVIDNKSRIWTVEEISILEDITASFISEIELRQALKTIEEEANLREEFIMIASHELKNPLSSLKLQTQMTQKKLLNGNLHIDENVKFFANVERQAKRLESLIDDMSDATRLSSGQLSLFKDFVNLNALTGSIVENLSETIQSSGNEVVIHSECDLNGEWDASRLEQVISNIIINALKYAPGTKITIHFNVSNSKALISIKDCGPGISEENQKKIFAKYGRAAESSSVKGLGLGLFISRQIIEEHGGNLDLISSVNEGSTFVISLPL